MIKKKNDFKTVHLYTISCSVQQKRLHGNCNRQDLIPFDSHWFENTKMFSKVKRTIIGRLDKKTSRGKLYQTNLILNQV